MRTAQDALVIDDLTMRFPVGRRHIFSPSKRTVLTALDRVSFVLSPGETLGIVGESGSGKSTLARIVAGLVDASEGEVRLGATELEAKRDRELSRRVQMVFQDPVSSLNPRVSVGSMLAEVLKVHRLVTPAGMRARLEELMAMVELPVSTLDRRPRSMSGGQRQRVGIARALALQPDVLILDEAIAALDVSVQASVLQVLRRLQRELGFSMIFISHDLGAVRGLCEAVAVMYLGRIVEVGPVDLVLRSPAHPYTRALIASELNIDAPRAPGHSGLKGEPPSPIDRPTGCAFRQRCPIARPDCAAAEPPIDMTAMHDAACFYSDPADRPGTHVEGAHV